MVILSEDVRLYFEKQLTEQATRIKEKGSGQVEKRRCFLETDIDW